MDRLYSKALKSQFPKKMLKEQRDGLKEKVQKKAGKRVDCWSGPLASLISLSSVKEKDNCSLRL